MGRSVFKGITGTVLDSNEFVTSENKRLCERIIGLMFGQFDFFSYLCSQNYN